MAVCEDTNYGSALRTQNKADAIDYVSTANFRELDKIPTEVFLSGVSLKKKKELPKVLPKEEFF